MRFYVEIEMDNDAFGDESEDENDYSHELARILRELAKKVGDGDGCGRIRDINGNTVGSFGVGD
jgi:hypothetical protein